MSPTGCAPQGKNIKKKRTREWGIGNGFLEMGNGWEIGVGIGPGFGEDSAGCPLSDLGGGGLCGFLCPDPVSCRVAPAESRSLGNRSTISGKT